MIKTRKMTEKEIANLERAERHTQARYDFLVADLVPGEWYEIVLDLSAESPAAVQRGFTAALRRRGLDAQFVFDGERMCARVGEG